MHMSKRGEVWVFAEYKEGKLKEDSLKLACEGRALANRLGKELSIVLIGYKIQEFAEAFNPYSVDKVFVIEDKLLEKYNGEAYSQILTNLAKRYEPSVVLFGATSTGNDLAPRIAAALEVSLFANCIEFDLDAKGKIVARKPMHGGKIHATITQCSKETFLATVDPNVLELKKDREIKKPQIIDVKMEIRPETIKTKPIDYIKADPRTVDVAEAEIVIALGRGLRRAEHMKIIEELADVLRASIGGTRPAVDEGWIPPERQIGSSGKDISSILHIACGISGSGHYQSGIRDAKFTVAINLDRSARIFKIADLAIVGSLHEVVPALTKKLQELRQKQ